MDKYLSLLCEIKEIKHFLKNIEKRLDDIESKVIDEHIELNEKDNILNKDSIWNSAKDIIERELTEVSFNTWIKPIIQFKVEGNIIYLGVCNDFTKSILEARYMDLLKNAVNKVTGNISHIKLVIEDSKKEVNNINNSNDYIFNSKYTFKNTIIGDENKNSYKGLLRFTKDIGKKPQVLYLHGDVGVGKTHMIHSLAKHALENNPKLNIKIIDIYEFTDSLIKSIANADKSFKESLLKKDLVIIDDFEEIIGKERTQEEFYVLVKKLMRLGGSIVISSTKPPETINTFKGKFSLNIEIENAVELFTPEFDTRIKILKLRLSQENIDIDDEHINIIANKYSDNMNELLNGLNKAMNSIKLNG